MQIMCGCCKTVHGDVYGKWFENRCPECGTYPPLGAPLRSDILIKFIKDNRWDIVSHAVYVLSNYYGGPGFNNQQLHDLGLALADLGASPREAYSSTWRGGPVDMSTIKGLSQATHLVLCVQTDHKLTAYLSKDGVTAWSGQLTSFDSDILQQPFLGTPSLASFNAGLGIRSIAIITNQGCKCGWFQEEQRRKHVSDKL